MLVDIFLLRVVNAHKGLDRLDDALRIPNEIAISVLRLKALGNPSQQPCKVEDLTMRPAHCGQAMTIMQKLRKTRINSTFIVSLVLNDLGCYQSGSFANESRR